MNPMNATVLAVFTTLFWLWFSLQSEISLYSNGTYTIRTRVLRVFSLLCKWLYRIDFDILYILYMSSAFHQLRNAPEVYRCVTWLHSRQHYTPWKIQRAFSILCHQCLVYVSAVPPFLHTHTHKHTRGTFKLLLPRTEAYWQNMYHRMAEANKWKVANTIKYTTITLNCVQIDF